MLQADGTLINFGFNPDIIFAGDSRVNGVPNVGLPRERCASLFGGGTNTAQDALNQFTTLGVPLNLQLYQNNLSLGSALKANTTLFIQYRTGGGLSTNLGTNVINQVGTVSFFVNGPSESINQAPSHTG